MTNARVLQWGDGGCVKNEYEKRKLIDVPFCALVLTKVVSGIVGA